MLKMIIDLNKLGPGEVLFDPLHGRRKLVVARGAEDYPEEAWRRHAHRAAGGHSHADLVHQPPRERCLCTNTATPSLFREEWNSFHFDFILGFKLREREDTNVQHNAKIYRRFSTPAIGRQPRSKVEPGEEAGLGGEVGNPCLVQD